jgi:hypothetical protein
MKKLFISLEILLGIAAVATYLAAKLHFFINYDGNLQVYLQHHWPFWAAQAIILSALAGVEVMRRRIEIGEGKPE